MGTVMLVRDKKTEKYFAAKKIERNDHIAKANIELETMKKLEKHPRIVRVFESYYTLGTHKLIMIIEYCPCKYFLYQPLTFFFLQMAISTDKLRIGSS